MPPATLDPISLPHEQEEQVKVLRHLLQKGKAYLAGPGGENPMELPEPVYGLLLQILEGLRDGKGISIVPVTQELTTQQAAGILHVSRPYFVKLLEQNKMPFHVTGTHRRVYLSDLLEFKQRRDTERHEAIDRIGKADEEAGLYDRVLLPEV